MVVKNNPADFDFWVHRSYYQGCGAEPEPGIAAGRSRSSN